MKTFSLRSIGDKQYRQVLKAALDAGCDLRYTGSGHISVKCPNGGIVVCPSTPSDVRSMLNVRSTLRRIGELNV